MSTAVAPGRRVLACAAVLLWSGFPKAAETRLFPHDDARLLRDDQRNGGAVFVPSALKAAAPAPLIVFLHGTNPRGVPHLWFGGLGKDLRPAAEQLAKRGEARPFLLAAPSQTVRANLGHALWTDFVLDRFVDDVAGALGGRAQVDLDAVYLFGHSGAGCNPEAGLAADFTAPGARRPLAIVSIDPCLDQEMGLAFARRGSAVPLWVLWQSQVWPRDVDAWTSALLFAEESRPGYRISHLSAPGLNPHSAVVPIAFQAAVRELLKREPSER